MKWSLEMKVGVFAVLACLLIALSTIKVSKGSGLFWGGGYDVEVTVQSAVGIDTRTKVQIAGIGVGRIKQVRLAEDGRRATATIHIDDSDLQIPKGSRVVVRAKGFLGNTYVEIVPNFKSAEMIPPGGELRFGGVGGDINMMVNRFNDIADDIKVVSESVRELVEKDDAPIRNTVTNLDAFATLMRELIERNERSINTITDNLSVISSQLRSTIAESRRDAVDSFTNVASITRKVDEGEGTIGKLINDEETVSRVNNTLEALEDTLGGLRGLETELGYHTEFLGGTKDFKHYVHLDLWPRPDQAFLFEFVEDRSPSPNRTSRTTTVTSGGTSTTVTADTQTTDRNQFRLSAQLAKQLYDFTLRGGVIESRGGVGFDYTKGPIKLSASAFDFNTQQGKKPHLKFTGTVKVTPAFYFMGGADDPLNRDQSFDWFVGAGLRIRDDDIKSLLSAGALSAVSSK